MRKPTCKTKKSKKSKKYGGVKNKSVIDLQNEILSNEFTIKHLKKQILEFEKKNKKLQVKINKHPEYRAPGSTHLTVEQLRRIKNQLPILEETSLTLESNFPTLQEDSVSFDNKAFSNRVRAGSRRINPPALNRFKTF